MPSKQVKDILDHVRSAHHQLNQTCKRLGAEEADSRLQMLLEYLGRHEERFCLALKRYEENAGGKGVLETWLKFPSDEDIEDALKDLDLHAGMSAEEIIQQVLSFDARLIALYRNLENSVPSSQVRAFFADLAQLEEGHEHQYARILQE